MRLHLFGEGSKRVFDSTNISCFNFVSFTLLCPISMKMEEILNIYFVSLEVSSGCGEISENADIHGFLTSWHIKKFFPNMCQNWSVIIISYLSIFLIKI